MFKLKDFIKRKWWIILIVIVVINLLSKESTNPENSSSENHSSSIYSCKDCGAGLGAYGTVSKESTDYDTEYNNMSEAFDAGMQSRKYWVSLKSFLCFLSSSNSTNDNNFSGSKWSLLHDLLVSPITFVFQFWQYIFPAGICFTVIIYYMNNWPRHLMFRINIPRYKLCHVCRQVKGPRRRRL
jgi:hypothetical protein